MEILFAVLAAAANALGAVLQRRGAARAPDSDSMHLRLVLDLVRQPVWAGGIAAMILGVLFQALALSRGALALVAPVIIVELPFTLVLAVVILHRKADKQTIMAILVTTAALAVLLFIASPSGGQPNSVPASTWMITIGATLGAVAALIAAAERLGRVAKAALLGVAAGVGHGLAATLMKATTALASQGALAILTSWKLYVVILAGGGSLYLYQNALQAGPVVAVQPGVSITDPLLGVLLGLLLFAERVRAGLLIAPEAVCAALVVAGIVVLARSPLLQDDDEREGDGRANEEDEAKDQDHNGGRTQAKPTSKTAPTAA